MAEAHPTLLELELLRTGEAGAEVARHVEGCAACRAHREQLLALGAALRVAAPALPPEVEARLLAAARRRRGRGVGRWLVLAGPAAAAAAVIIALAPHASRHADETLAPRVARADVDGDGAVDIRDALRLAQLVRDGRAAGWDLNHDARVDAADVDAVATLAVSLGGAP